jgi:hypothetical protein
MKSLWCVVLLLAALAGTASADRWIALWTEDDSWLGMKDSGEVWQLVPGQAPTYFGTFQPPPVPTVPTTWGRVKAEHR